MFLSSAIRIGHTDQKSTDIAENIIAAANHIASVIPRGKKNIKSLHLKTNESVALPIYTSLPDKPSSADATQLKANVSADEVGKNDVKSTLKEKKKEVEDSIEEEQELSTEKKTKTTLKRKKECKREISIDEMLAQDGKCNSKGKQNGSGNILKEVQEISTEKKTKTSAKRKKESKDEKAKIDETKKVNKKPKKMENIAKETLKRVKKKSIVRNKPKKPKII